MDGGSRARNARHRPTASRANGVAVRVRFCHFQAISRKRATSRPPDPFPSKSASSGDAAPPRYALPADLGSALKHLDDAQLDALLSSVAAEARRRGRPVWRRRGCIGAFRSEESRRRVAWRRGPKRRTGRFRCRRVSRESSRPRSKPALSQRPSPGSLDSHGRRSIASSAPRNGVRAGQLGGDQGHG